jgi:hypothetical protein
VILDTWPVSLSPWPSNIDVMDTIPSPSRRVLLAGRGAVDRGATAAGPGSGATPIKRYRLLRAAPVSPSPQSSVSEPARSRRSASLRIV